MRYISCNNRNHCIEKGELKMDLNVFHWNPVVTILVIGGLVFLGMKMGFGKKKFHWNPVVTILVIGGLVFLGMKMGFGKKK